MEGLVNWLNAPFNADQSAFKWFLFIGLLLVILALWNVIINDLRSIG